MNSSIFTHDSYKNLILSLIEAMPKGGRGVRRKLAEAMRCQVTYVSQVLAGPAHFSLEQVEAAGRYFGLSQAETEYLVLLVCENRSDSKALKSTLGPMIRKLREQHGDLKSRLSIRGSISEEGRMRYYSQWYYSAIHIALTVPELRTVAALGKRLKLVRRTVEHALYFLEEMGLARREGAEFFPTQSQIHLEKSSPLLPIHHANWRQQAIRSLEQEKYPDLHFSSAISCAKSDLPKICDLLTQCLEKITGLIRQSPEEELVSLNMDFFRT